MKIYLKLRPKPNVITEWNFVSLCQISDWNSTSISFAIPVYKAATSVIKAEGGATKFLAISRGNAAQFATTESKKKWKKHNILSA